MKKYLFSSKLIAAFAVVGAMAAVPAAASANPNSTSIFATAQGTSLLGSELPIVGTQGYTVTLPANTTIVPQAVANLLDFTITSQISVAGTQVANVYVDPQMVR